MGHVVKVGHIRIGLEEVEACLPRRLRLQRLIFPVFLHNISF
jgi:hypothetical protein